jgi:hypothetical protein
VRTPCASNPRVREYDDGEEVDLDRRRRRPGFPKSAYQDGDQDYFEGGYECRGKMWALLVRLIDVYVSMTTEKK